MSLEDLYTLNYPRLYIKAYKMLGQAEDAHDAVQEAFTRACKAWDTHRENVSAWLFWIVQNVCIDVLRHRKCIPMCPLDIETEEYIPGVDDFQDAVALMDAIDRTLARLVPLHQKMLQRAMNDDVHHKSDVEKQHLYRARKAFKREWRLINAIPETNHAISARP